jgi:predicted negative regulator of RcsB-dependent stress response
MTYFLSETYDKPKLVENRLVKKIINAQNLINAQNNEISIEEKIFTHILIFIKDNYKILGIAIIIIVGLYWRYYETQKKKQILNYNLYETDSESED